MSEKPFYQWTYWCWRWQVKRLRSAFEGNPKFRIRLEPKWFGLIVRFIVEQDLEEDIEDAN